MKYSFHSFLFLFISFSHFAPSIKGTDILLTSGCALSLSLSLSLSRSALAHLNVLYVIAMLRVARVVQNIFVLCCLTKFEFTRLVGVFIRVIHHPALFVGLQQ